MKSMKMKSQKVTHKDFIKAESLRKKISQTPTLDEESVNDVIDDVVDKLLQFETDEPGQERWEISRDDLIELSTNVLKLVGVKIV